MVHKNRVVSNERKKLNFQKHWLSLKDNFNVQQQHQLRIFYIPCHISSQYPTEWETDEFNFYKYFCG